jgi:hypothetical protein
MTSFSSSSLEALANLEDAMPGERERPADLDTPDRRGADIRLPVELVASRRMLSRLETSLIG